MDSNHQASDVNTILKISRFEDFKIFLFHYFKFSNLDLLCALDFNIETLKNCKKPYKILKKSFWQDGFFVEAGAAFCDRDSVTLPLELNLNWTGNSFCDSVTLNSIWNG